MTQPPGSYRQILRSSFIVGGAMMVNVVIGLVRSKTAAVLLGPTGVGLIGLFQSLMMFASTVAGMGLRTVGTRQIAEAVGKSDERAIGVARRALVWGTIGLAVMGGIVFWLARDVIARRVLQNASLTADVGLLAIGVALMVATGSQAALLTGMRRIGDVTRVTVWSSVAATVLGCLILAIWRGQGVLAFVLVAPATTFLLGHWLIARLRLPPPPPISLPELSRQWLTMAHLGVAFMSSAVFAVGTEFVVRVLIERRLGADALGQFFAAWTISATYVQLVLAAIGYDYYPRLVAMITDREAARRLLNEQTEVILLLAAPILLAVIGLAPFVTHLLYSRDFGAAAGVLRWQALGDVLLVVIWPLGYLLLARGRGPAYFLSEAVPLIVFAAATTIMLPWFGIQAAGRAFVVMNVVHLALVHWLARRASGWWAWRRDVTAHIAALAAAALVVFAAAQYADLCGAIVGVAAASAAGFYAIVRFSRMVDTAAGARIAGLIDRMIRAVGGRR